MSFEGEMEELSYKNAMMDDIKMHTIYWLGEVSTGN